ncbi:K+-transporting ATPase, F subunit (plasmid) [[Synechococcus] sp. NIES-970]|uniref:potassium-transporting ATPase subunit F n=1 Tax=Picosynechococcus sp. NKBG15041c TaxID=1407650 RepID=UPI0004038383|nr:potassium-transporting ATPase subunit F [Picosynechococcus sp. NKBG15041c]MBV5262157.1 potassium-transporting ATPase subunit F [Synechococcus moorigangaii CMS01]BAW97934.1 K+-transporting ATPase, F subunit [[Synechococcus] sp. NIES-970]
MNRFTLHPLEICNDCLGRLLQRRTRIALGLFLALCLNLAIAPALYAATDNFSRGNAYALGLLGLVVVGLAAYLTTVILKPEKF